MTTMIATCSVEKKNIDVSQGEVTLDVLNVPSIFLSFVCLGSQSSLMLKHLPVHSLDNYACSLCEMATFTILHNETMGISDIGSESS